MKFSASFLVLPLLAAAACDRAADPLSSSATTRHAAELAAAPAVREGYVTGAGGVQLFYHVEGSGPDTTVMVSGGPGLSYRYMQPDLGALTRGRTMIYFDQRGSGNSTIIHDPAQLAPALQVADIEAVRQHFGIDRMQLAGHSAGANFAALYAAAYPQHVERLLLLDPGAASGFYAAEFAQRRFERTDPAQFNQQLAWIGAFLGGQVPDAEAVQTCEALFTSVFTPYFADPANLAARQGRFCDEPVAQAQNAVFTLLTGLAAFDGAWDAAPVGAQITAPTLVVYGDADVLSLGNAQHWASSIAGSRFEVIQGAGHFPWLEKPAQFNAIVNTFLRRSDVLN